MWGTYARYYGGGDEDDEVPIELERTIAVRDSSKRYNVAVVEVFNLL